MGWIGLKMPRRENSLRRSAMTSEKTNSQLADALQSAIAGDVFVDPVIRGVYSTDASLFQVIPQCVVVPKDAADVLAAIRIAGRFSLPITARGGGTSLSGQTFGPGMVIDFSKHLNAVLSVDVDKQTAWVQSGVILDQLNATLRPHGLHFAPDPATGSRATIGGMIGNNTCGTRSIVYGKTIDHVLETRVVLADGTVCHFKERDDDFLDQLTYANVGEAKEAELLRQLRGIIDINREEIIARYPRVLRRVSGYNLDEFVDNAGYLGSIGPRGSRLDVHRVWNLSNLIVGSEGTLGILLDAKIRLMPLPAATALCVVHFDSLDSSLRAVDQMLEHRPSTVELLDVTVMDEARVNPATAHMAHFIDGHPQAVQIVEFQGENTAQAKSAAEAFADEMQARSIGVSWPVFSNSAAIRDVWETRKLGLGLISNVQGAIKGRDFIEDACVPTEHLADYIQKIQSLCASENIDRLSIYAHASVGVVHVVPALDLHLKDEAAKMQRIADQAFQWVMEVGGSWSGEHGDGQLRGRFLPLMFGPKIYDAFKQVKQLFDPNQQMNPGKVIDAASLSDNLRYQTPNYQINAAKSESSALYRYAAQGGLQLAIEQCNGVGACRKINSGTMCPSYMATRDEQHSTRGRANALRLAMSGQLGSDPISALASDEVNEVMKLCLACKACKSECPNAVDMAKLKSEVLQMRNDQHGVSLGTRLLGAMPDAAARLAGKAGRLANFASLIPGGRMVLEKLTGIDRRRPLPPFATRRLTQVLESEPVPTGRRDRGRVVLFDDTYANFFEPHVGRSAVALLEDCGFEVILAKAGCCQRPRLSKGLVREAKKLGTKTFEKLDHYARQELPILCLEPSCASALADDLADLVDDVAMSKRVAKQVQMIDQFLVSEGIEISSDSGTFLLHGHCHQKAQFGTEAILNSFAANPTASCDEVDAGCCGMAGSFGYEQYELSQKIGEQRLFPAIRDAVASKKTIIACGISCRHQIKDFCNVTAKHWVEVAHAKR